MYCMLVAPQFGGLWIGNKEAILALVAGKVLLHGSWKGCALTHGEFVVDVLVRFLAAVVEFCL